MDDVEMRDTFGELDMWDLWKDANNPAALVWLAFRHASALLRLQRTVTDEPTYLVITTDRSKMN